MDEIDEAAVTSAIGEKLPVEPKELMSRLELWLDLAVEPDAAKHLIKDDGSMNDDLYCLLKLAYTYFLVASRYSESTTALCLRSARIALLRALAEMIRPAEKAVAR